MRLTDTLSGRKEPFAPAGDEVLTTPFTFAGTLNAIIASGATARFADIDLDDFNLDPELIEASVSSSTRAVLPVHLYGLPCRLDEVAMIAGRDRIRIVEDARHVGVLPFEAGCKVFLGPHRVRDRPDEPYEGRR